MKVEPQGRLQFPLTEAEGFHNLTMGLEMKVKPNSSSVLLFLPKLAEVESVPGGLRAWSPTFNLTSAFPFGREV